MRYALLIYEDEAASGVLDGPHKLRDQHMAFVAMLQEKGVMTGGAGLKPSTAVTTLRSSPAGTQSVHDGPFAEVREQLAGFYVVEVADLDEALALARATPLTQGGAIEIRPVI